MASIILPIRAKPLNPALLVSILGTAAYAEEGAVEGLRNCTLSELQNFVQTLVSRNLLWRAMGLSSIRPQRSGLSLLHRSSVHVQRSRDDA